MSGFSLEQALAAQRALRATLGLGEEIFPVPAFLGMVGDEIRQMRAAGHDDRAILRIIETATGHALCEDDLRRYAGPDGARGQGPGPQG